MRAPGKRLYVMKKLFGRVGKLEHDMVSCLKQKRTGSLVLSVPIDRNTIHHASYYIKDLVE